VGVVFEWREPAIESIDLTASRKRDGQPKRQRKQRDKKVRREEIGITFGIGSSNADV